MWEKHALSKGQKGGKDFERENEGQNRSQANITTLKSLEPSL